MSIQTQQLEQYLQAEEAALVVLFAAVTWLFYKIFLKNVSAERHESLRGKFRGMVPYLLAALGFLVAYWLLREISPSGSRLSNYVGVAALVLGLVVIVLISRIFVLQYLFIGSMETGVPRLLVNIFSLCLSLTLGLWFANAIMEISLAPLLATSAVLSIVLGLALQESLGNLFAGIAMQFDKPYQIGDWIEVMNGGQKIIGKVREITWRATLLKGWGDEMITLPNRVMAQAQVSNFSLESFIRSHVFRLPLDCDLELAKQTLQKVIRGNPAVLESPPPLTLVVEITDSCIVLRAIYSIDAYASHVIIGDEVYSAGLRELVNVGIRVAPARMQLLKEL